MGCECPDFEVGLLLAEVEAVEGLIYNKRFGNCRSAVNKPQLGLKVSAMKKSSNGGISTQLTLAKIEREKMWP